MEAECFSKMKQTVTTCCKSDEKTIVCPLRVMIRHRRLFMSGLFVQLQIHTKSLTIQFCCLLGSVLVQVMCLILASVPQFIVDFLG